MTRIQHGRTIYHGRNICVAIITIVADSSKTTIVDYTILLRFPSSYIGCVLPVDRSFVLNFP